MCGQNVSGEIAVPAMPIMVAMHSGLEQFWLFARRPHRSEGADGLAGLQAQDAHRVGHRHAPSKGLPDQQARMILRRTRMRDKASQAPVVVLHLRPRYVSKAAILTVPAPSVPAENRSPA